MPERADSVDLRVDKSVDTARKSASATLAPNKISKLQVSTLLVTPTRSVACKPCLKSTVQFGLMHMTNNLSC